MKEKSDMDTKIYRNPKSMRKTVQIHADLFYMIDQIKNKLGMANIDSKANLISFAVVKLIFELFTPEEIEELKKGCLDPKILV